MRSFVAGLALLLAGVIGTAALGAYVAHQTVLDPDRAGQVLAAALEQPTLRETILARTIPGYDRLPQVARDAVEALAGTSQVSDALTAVRLDSDGTIPLAPLRDQLTRTLRENGQVAVAAVVAAAGGPDRVDVPPDVVARYDRARDTTWQVATQGAIAVGVLFLLALLVSRNRRATVRGIGLTILVSAAVVAFLYWVSPDVARAASTSPWVDAATPVRDAERSTVLAILIPTAVIGILVMAVSFLVPRPHARARQDR
jgi:hypothetical protein